MPQSGEEISYKELVDRGSFRAGLIRFRKKEVLDEKNILHKRDDVLCYIISGHGILRMGNESKEVYPGSILHIPYGNSHDFVADNELLVFYVKITETV